MKRGFLNTPRSKRAIEEAYAPRSPPDGTQPRSGQDSTDGAAKKARAPAKENATPMDVDALSVQEVFADGQPAAMWKMRSAETETEKEDDKSVEHKSKGKGKEKAVDSDGASDRPAAVPLRPWNRNPPGWGRHPDEEFFHTVPESHGSKKRTISRLWPRDPNGKTLIPNPAHGTLSPDGYPWAATLYDIYAVNRVPHAPGFVSYMTGSAICRAMEIMGELETAAPEIEWARSEGQPRVEGAADTEELIRCIDSRLLSFPNLFAPMGVTIDEELTREVNTVTYSAGRGDESQDDGHEAASDEEVDFHKDSPDPRTIPPPPEIPVTSPFHPSHYPKPWPFTPFERPDLTILLQERIPLHLLPGTLYVHDPFCLLFVQKKRDFENTAWTSRPDIVRTYNLRFSSATRKKCEEARRKTQEMETFKSRTLVIMRYKRTKEQVRNNEPAIEVPLPPYPVRPTKIEEAHLYLSPVADVGKGHHSVVYKGEWELPREIFVKKRICPLCFEDSAGKEIQRLKDTGRWAKMLKVASCGLTRGANEHSEYQPSQADLDAVNDPINLARDGEIIEREITCIVPSRTDPAQALERVEQSSIWDEFMANREFNQAQLVFTGDDADDESPKDSYTPVIRIDPPFSYEIQEKTCTHRRVDGASPLTATFTVVAKLSLEGDSHLNREGRNYQDFPERFFRHYNGYTIIPQMKTIVPVNAIVPQFYGYYTPQKKKEGSPDKYHEPRYLSPILLLEHCGEQIDPETLSEEDQEECVSMLLRFQRAGWLHESVAPRNFLVQRGKPTEFPLMRLAKPELSFRLIDFGRSRRYTTADEKQSEEREALRIFADLAAKVGVTLSLGDVVP